MAMEVSGIALQPLPGAGFRRKSDTNFADFSLGAVSGSGSRPSCKLSRASFALGSRVPSRSRRFSGLCRFSNNGHSRYYATAVVPTCDGKKKEKEKEKEKRMEAKEIKKRLKFIKGLSKDLSAFSGMGFGIEAGEGLTGEVKGKMISEAADVLLAQLRLLRAEEEELQAVRKKKGKGNFVPKK